MDGVLPRRLFSASVYRHIYLRQLVGLEAGAQRSLADINGKATQLFGKLQPIGYHVANENLELATQDDFGHRQHAKADRTRTHHQNGLNVRSHQLTALHRVSARAHDIQQQGRLGGGKLVGYRKEDVLVNQLELAVASVSIESHISALLETLVGETQPAGAALAAEVH